MSNVVSGMFGGGGGSSGGPLGSGLLSGLTGSRSLGALQAASSFTSMLGSMAAGKAQEGAYDVAAGDARLDASGAIVQGASQVAGLRQTLTQTLGARQAAAGAAGVDVGQGTVASTRTALTDRADTATKLDLTGADIMSRKYQINALNDEMMGNAANTAAKQQGAGELLSTGLSLLKMGIG